MLKLNVKTKTTSLGFFFFFGREEIVKKQKTSDAHHNFNRIIEQETYYINIKTEIKIFLKISKMIAMIWHTLELSIGVFVENVI